MKRNLLMLLFAMLVGMFTANAAVTFTVDIDNVESAIVTVDAPPSPYGGGTPVALVAGQNAITSESGNCYIMPADGFTPVVTLNGQTQELGYRPFYQLMYVAEGAVIKITNGGEVVKTIDTYFLINNPETATVTTNGETIDIINGNMKIKAGEYAKIAPKEGYVISNFTQYSLTDIVENSDGTIDFMPAEYGYISLETKKAGIDFNININVPSNVIVNAFNAANEDLGSLDIAGYQSPYTATAPLDAVSLAFTAPEDGTINSIKRIAADGTESDLTNSGESGWRSALTAGDTFTIDAIGPEVEVKFKGADAGNSWSAIALSSTFVVKVGDNTINFTAGETEETVKVRIGDIVTVSAARGYELYPYGAITGYECCNKLVSSGPVQTAMIIGAGTMELAAREMTDMIVNIDNKDAVTVTGRNGNGSVVTLVNGENRLESVQNPLKITANEGYQIASVVLDGENVVEKDGGYTAELLAGSTLSITTREADKPFMVCIFPQNGEISDLIIKKDGKEVEYDGLTVMNGDEITISAKLGYIIDTISDTMGNKISYDEKTNAYTVKFSNSATMITVTFVKAEENETFLGFECNSPSFYLIVFDKDGNRKYEIIDKYTDNIYSGRTAKVEIGDKFRISTLFSNEHLTSMDVNGVVTEFEGEDTRMSDLVEIDGRTIVKATVAQNETLISISGSQSLETEIGSGVVIGTIYINEVGNMSASARPGDNVKVIPVPAKGYKFDKFSYFDGEKEVDYSFDILGPDAEGVYNFTIPEDYDAEFIYMRGFFVLDTDNPAYLIQGNNIYANVGSDEEDILLGYVAINGGMDLFAYPGEKVEIGFYQNPDYINDYECEYFCSYTHPDTPLKYEIVNGRCYYTVNSDDVAFSNVISITAHMKKIEGGQGGINGVDADSDFYFDAASGTVYSSSDVKVYNIGGQLVETFTAGENSLENLPAGVYLLSNGVKTLKIAK